MRAKSAEAAQPSDQNEEDVESVTTMYREISALSRCQNRGDIATVAASISRKPHGEAAHSAPKLASRLDHDGIGRGVRPRSQEYRRRQGYACKAFIRARNWQLRNEPATTSSSPWTTLPRLKLRQPRVRATFRGQPYPRARRPTLLRSLRRTPVEGITFSVGIPKQTSQDLC